MKDPHKEREILLSAAKLDIGDSTMVSCPFCNAEHEQKFRVTRYDNGLLYYCLRASCGVGGFVKSNTYLPSYQQEDKPAKKPKFNYLTRRLQPLSSTMRTRLWKKYSVFAKPVWKQLDENTLVMPVHNVVGTQIGWTIKNFQPTPGIGKSRHYLNGPDSRPFMHFDYPEFPDGSYIVIVEDMLSAARFTQLGHVGIALLGTSIDVDKIKQILCINKLMKYDKVILWLDFDASHIAYKAIKRYSGLFDGKLSIRHSFKDPKDLDSEQLAKNLESHSSHFREGWDLSI